jgi:hypothetical protein
MAENLIGEGKLEQVVDLVVKYYQRMKKHYFEDDRVTGGRRGEFDAEYRALCQTLISANLNEIGLPADRELCQGVVDRFAKETPGALARWIERQEDPLEKWANATDSRIKMIFELAKEKFSNSS